MIIINLLSRKRYYIQTYCLFTVAILLIASCEKEAKSDTYIAGKIINPHLEYVTIKDFNGFNDTIPLSDDGSFSKSYNYLSPGFYTFSHPRESQTVYLSPGDSTVLRLNTKAFDESLAFSGSHAKENNYLINLFIQIEEEERMFLENYRLPQARFKRMIDSITSVRLKNL